MISEETEASETEDIQDDITENPQEYDIRQLPGRTIAGETTSCFSIDTEQATVEYCFSREGVPLYIKMVSENFLSELTATEYGTSVSNADFELPAEPGESNIDYGDLIAQYS